jgi:hypothetical protein
MLVDDRDTTNNVMLRSVGYVLSTAPSDFPKASLNRFDQEARPVSLGSMRMQEARG